MIKVFSYLIFRSYNIILSVLGSILLVKVSV